jgi:hypothetical protein
MLAEVLAISLWFHHHAGPKAAKPLERHGRVHGWHWAVHTDKFTSQVSCKLETGDIHVRSQTVIFNLRPGVETTHAFFRVDDSPARPVSDLFADVQKHGIFPERGWIDDRRGGEAALPLELVSGAHHVWIRPSPKARVHKYDVSRLPQALAVLKAAGCPDGVL